MEKDRGIKIALVIVAVIAIVAAGVAFASYSAALNIEGTGTVKSANWEVRFENLSSAILTGNAKEVTHPTINTNDSSISTYDVILVLPGDAVSYTFDVANNGTFDVKISSVNVPKPTCTGTYTSAEADAINVCHVMKYTLTYEDGSAVNVGDELPAGTKKSMKLTLTYGIVGGANLPDRDVQLSNLDMSIIYAQK